MQEFEKFACLLAKISADVIRQYFRTPFSVDTKQDASPVTIADKKAEEIMRELIMKEFPEHGILGEEFGNYNTEAEYIWVVDPIDGTLNFICGGLMFGTLIALVQNGLPILGIIHQPILNELLLGNNSQTTLNDTKVTVRACGKISDAVFLTTDPYLIKKHQNFAGLEALRQQVKVYRCWGDCYGYLLLALGCVDIMVDAIMNPWDIMALIPTVRGAGGIITDYHGKDPIKGASIIATGGEIHNQVIAILNN
ncbi:MAG: histidinol-phosphatase [bacterium]